jgi:Rieske Fe-S protein
MSNDKGQPVEDDGRRLFLKLGVHGLGAGVAAVTAVPAVAYLTFPLTTKTTFGADSFLTVGRSARFKDGEPIKVDLIADKTDAWNRITNVKVGSAWVLKHGDELIAYSTVCPHLGCAVDYDGAAGKFKCPCHRSAFGKDGGIEEGPAPRVLDKLEVKDEAGLVSIRYQRFKVGVSDKVVV